MKAIVSDLKSFDETRQGEAFYMPEIDEVNDINLKRFYIELRLSDEFQRQVWLHTG
jgi:hypothetical protein